MPRLTEEQKQEIIKLYEIGATKKKALAAQFNVSYPTIMRVLENSRGNSRGRKRSVDTIILEFKDASVSLNGQFFLFNGTAQIVSGTLTFQKGN